MHEQCTSHDTMHEQTIPTTCTHKTTDTMPYIQRNWEIQRHLGTHPSSELGVLLAMPEGPHRGQGIQRGFTMVSVMGAQVQLHKVQEVVQIYQAFLRNILVSRESSFGPGGNLSLADRSFQQIWKPQKTWNKGNVKRSFNMSELEHSIHPSLLLRPFLLCSSYHKLCIQVRFRGFSLQTSIIRHMLVYMRCLHTIHTTCNTAHRKSFFFFRCPAVSQGPKTPGKDWPVRPGVGHSIGLDEHSIEIKQDWKLPQKVIDSKCVFSS